MRPYFVLLPLAAACSSSFSSKDSGPNAPGDGAPTTPSNVQTPSMKGDCTSIMNNDGNLVALDWSTLVFDAGNCSDDGHACLAVKSTTGETAPEVWWMISVPLESVGQPIDLSRPPSGLQLSLIIHNTTYGLLADHPGEIHGTLTMASFDPAAGRARVVFSGATMTGEDSIYAFHARCAIDGAIDVQGFAATPIGARCKDDHECGGSFSGKVCDDASFVCAQGCHVDDDCPSGSLCDTSSRACATGAGASSDEIAICQKACHDMTFFKCTSDEAACNARCASEPRSKVKGFDTCTDGSVVGECAAAQACLAAL